jgi:HK97 family phage major capsid protein
VTASNPRSSEYTTARCPLCKRDLNVGEQYAGANYCRALAIVDVLARHPGATAWELSQLAGVPYYMEETTFTNAAAETAESGAKPEATIAFTERTEAVRKIAVTLPATDEVLADVPVLGSWLSERLAFMVRQRLDTQVVSGDGTAPNLSGILDRAGIQTQAKGADPVPDAIYKAATLVYTSQFLEPDAVVIHPNDWRDVRLLRTADGLYIFGSPGEAGELHRHRESP